MLGKINPFTISSASWEMRVHIFCGRLKAGAGKEMGELKPTAASTKNSWTCSPLGNKAGAAGWEKGLMVPCASPINNNHASLSYRRVTGDGVQALLCTVITQPGLGEARGQEGGKQKYLNMVLEVPGFSHHGMVGWYFC